MILKQFYLNCLAHASYLIGDEASGTACVVDPQRDIDQYLTFAEGHGLTIKHVILTHFHADFIAGHLELRDSTGARIYLGRAAQAEYAFTPLGDGDRIEDRNILNAQLAWSNGDLVVTAYGTNITDQHYVGASNTGLRFAGPPRQFGVQVLKSF